MLPLFGKIVEIEARAQNAGAIFTNFCSNIHKQDSRDSSPKSSSDILDSLCPNCCEHLSRASQASISAEHLSQASQPSISAKHLSNPQKCSAMLNNVQKCSETLRYANQCSIMLRNAQEF